MPHPDDSTDRDPLDLLAEEFLQRRRSGERLDVESFAAAHPALQQALRELLPTLLMLEQCKRDRESTGSTQPVVPALQRLGDFRILGEVGRGGMGVVFAAVQESLGRKVALKVLPQAALLTGSQLLRFRREAQTAAKLHHTNIVPVYGSGESDGYHWYAMQFIGGQSLDAWRSAQAQQPPVGPAAWSSRARFVARLGVQAASALHYAHSQGTLHRDIKPANLLLEGGEHLWVTDFGLAKAMESEGLTHSGDLLGTLQYMAPEQFAGRYDVRSEVYALGVTMYELLLLRAAHQAKTRSELMERVRTERPPSLRRILPELPVDLALILDRAMAKEPADRYVDAAALQADLQAFLEDRPIAARRTSTLALAWRWCRQNRLLAGFAAATLLAVVGAGITGWISYSTTQRALDAAELARLAAEQALAEAGQQSRRADDNLRLALAGFGDVFDALVGRDSALAYEEDLDTGQTAVIARTIVDPQSIELLQKMLSFYDEFAVANVGNQDLRLETARAQRRVGAIYVRLGHPEQLERARSAYLQAEQLLGEPVERDVARELAALQLEFGQLEHRRGDLAAAAVRLQAALLLLEKDPQADSKAVRHERAQLHFLLAQLADPSTLAASQRGAGIASGPGGREGWWRELGRLLQDAKHHQQQAMKLLQTLLAGEPQHPEYRASLARALLLELPWRFGEAASRGGEPGRTADTGPRRGERGRDPQQEAQRRQGIAIFRELVANQPAADQLRYELCRALVEDLRREERGREFGPRGRRDNAASGEQELALLREAREHATILLEQQPLLPEYAALRASLATLMGRVLRDRAEQLTGEQAQALRLEAKGELLLALELEQRQPVPNGLPNTRQMMQAMELRRTLATVLLALGERELAVAQLQDLLDRLEAPLRAAETRAAEGRPLLGPMWPGLRPRAGETSNWILPERLLQALDSPQLSQRAKALQNRLELLPTAPRGERDQPAENRRGGR